ncbi:MAG: SRPBCC family protein, partial [Thermoplasmata archaeon]
MPDEELDPILIQVTVPLPIPMIYAAFTDPAQLKGWLCDSARVDPRVGGEYVLSWSGATPFESGGEILRMQPDLDIEFSWRAPPPYGSLLNFPEPKTRVYVRLTESPEGIDVTLEHSGWGSGEAWAAARSWHFHLWDERLHLLKDYLIKA